MFFSLIPQDDCRLPNYFDDSVIAIQTNGFDADSEGSDSELVPNMNRTTETTTMNSKFSNINHKIEDKIKCIFVLQHQPTTTEIPNWKP